VQKEDKHKQIVMREWRRMIDVSFLNTNHLTIAKIDVWIESVAKWTR